MSGSDFRCWLIRESGLMQRFAERNGTFALACQTKTDLVFGRSSFTLTTPVGPR